MQAQPAAAALPGVLIVDDSAVARAVMKRMIEDGGRLSVVQAVADAGTALCYLAAHRVDAIVLDLEMPGISGLEALPRLIAASAGTPVLVVSAACDDGAAATIRALALGATDTLVKPGIGNFAGRFAATLEQRLLRLLAERGRAAPAPPGRTPVLRVPDFDVIAIGASTGGIHALSHILRAVGPELRQPILITQHLPASFMPYFATQVALVAGRPCEIAQDRMRLRENMVVLAPGDAHMRCVSLPDGAALRLSREKAASACMPSVDPMLDSVAAVFGKRALAIVLSGMGRDGAVGAQRIAAAGGTVVVQDEASSVVWGMPGAIAALGIADAILPPAAIGALIAGRRRPS